jgi:hypothetical protein
VATSAVVVVVISIIMFLLKNASGMMTIMTFITDASRRRQTMKKQRIHTFNVGDEAIINNKLISGKRRTCVRM